MAATAKINVNTDPQTKREAEKIFDAIGMNMTTAINVFLKKAIQYKGIPFDVCVEIPNAVTEKAIEDSENGNDVYGPFDSVEALMESLNA